VLKPGTAATARKLREAASVGQGIVEPDAKHCSSVHGQAEVQCRDAREPSLKQKRNVRLLAGLNKVAAPDVEKMSFDEAERFIGKHWKAWMEHEEL